MDIGSSFLSLPGLHREFQGEVIEKFDSHLVTKISLIFLYFTSIPKERAESEPSTPSFLCRLHSVILDGYRKITLLLLFLSSPKIKSFDQLRQIV